MPFKKGNEIMLGKKHSEETKRKIGIKSKNRFFSAETRKKMGKAMKGRKHSLETIEKMREARKKQTISLETRKKMSLAKLGDKCVNWKGGITKENDFLRHSFEMKLWRESVFKRDNYRCIWCGRKSNVEKDEKDKYIILNADHIKPFAHYPELRFAIDNGRTLCVPCHKTTDTYKGKSK